MKKSLSAILVAATVLGIVLATPAHADDNSQAQIQALQAQIQLLNNQLNNLAKKVSAYERQTAAVPAPATTAAPVPVTPAVAPYRATAVTAQAPPVRAAAPRVANTLGSGQVGPIKYTLGGYIEGAAAERSKNLTADPANSSFNTAIPFNNSVNAHQTEFRETARGSRLWALAESNVDANTSLAAYIEGDLEGAGTTSNSIETNSYVPRLRNGYATVDQKDLGLQVLAGQNWSLLTTNKVGISPRQENIPTLIDTAGIPGFTYTRSPQLRIVDSFDNNRITAGVSAESPQVSFGGITVPGTVNATNGGTAALTGVTSSTDIAPDLIAKLAADPGWGHYEVFGLMRFFHDNVASTDHNNVAIGEGGGLAAIVPVIRKKLEVQANVMAGQGIGRYGSAQLPDFAFSPTGGIHPLTEFIGLVGITGHPTSSLDLYTYAGEERVLRYNTANTTYGYGDFALNNSGCYVENGSCSAQTSSVWSISPGLWDTIYKGNYGSLKIGLEDFVTIRTAFSDSSGRSPSALVNTILTSIRFSPF